MEDNNMDRPGSGAVQIPVPLEPEPMRFREDEPEPMSFRDSDPEPPESADAPGDIPGPDAVDAEGEGEDQSDGSAPARPHRRLKISGNAAILLTGTFITAVLMAVALIWDLPDPAWSILMIAGFLVSLLPLVLKGVSQMSRGVKIPGPFILLFCAAAQSLTGRLLPAAVTATVYNLLSAVYDIVSRREMDFVKERLERFKVRKKGILAARVDNHLREVSQGRIQALVEYRDFERRILPIAAGAALFFSVVPALIDGMNFLRWINRGLIILAVCVYDWESGLLMNSLNCSEASFRNGVYFSGAGIMSACSEVSSVFFNKTGTLTDGDFRVTNIEPVRISENELLYLAVLADAYSDHPLAKAVRLRADLEPDRDRIKRHRTEPGYGSLVQLTSGQLVAAGNIDFMEGLGVKGNMFMSGETCIFVAVNRTCVGRIDFADTVRQEARSVIPALKRAGVANVGLMTGDNALCATNLGRQTGITEVYSDCRPKDKSARLQYILETQEHDDRLLFVSADKRDRELLEMANISVTVGLAPDCTVNFPDVVLPPDELVRLPVLIRASRQLRKNETVNFLAACGVRALTILLGLTGVLPMWAAVAVTELLQFFTFMNTKIHPEADTEFV